MRYEFKTTQGRVCCSGDGAQRLCPACEARAKAPMPSAREWGRALETAPPPPDMVAGILAHRGIKKLPISERPIVNGVPAPPDMVAAIHASRGGR
jgi:hypothetical protein